jgi:hypothetical protein
MEISQSPMVYADALPLTARTIMPRLTSRFNPEAPWRWIALAFTAYWAVFVAGAYANKPELNNLGATFILVTLGWATIERLWVRVDAVAVACLLAALLSLLTMSASSAEKHPDAVVKHVSLYLVMAFSRVLRLPIVSSSKTRWVLAAQILTILVLSVMTDRGGVWDGGTRHSGLFANPNNLALIPFLLLFFIDRTRDPRLVRLGAHAIVVGVLALSGTSGAVIAYAIGLAIHFGALLHRHWRMLVLTLLALGGLTVTGLMVSGGESFFPETRLSRQITVMRTELNTVIEGGQVAYYDQERVLGPGAASGIWRLVHWRKTINMYAEGTAAQQLTGFGIGSSPGILGKLPHNEYLRVLFEQGVIGLALFLFAWSRIIRNAPRDVRYCGVILAVYSFSENNLDNFPFMSLFILCLSAAGKQIHAARLEESAPEAIQQK